VGAAAPSDRGGAAPPAGLGLTPRELEVLILMAKGLDNAEIARRLWISKYTLQHHITAIYRKLGKVNRARAIVHAIRHGMADPKEGVP
jgi:DNA-binding CsgD family transcriptional regulator